MEKKIDNISGVLYILAALALFFEYKVPLIILLGCIIVLRMIVFIRHFKSSDTENKGFSRIFTFGSLLFAVILLIGSFRH